LEWPATSRLSAGTHQIEQQTLVSAMFGWTTQYWRNVDARRRFYGGSARLQHPNNTIISFTIESEAMPA
jgi:hypothetical protein